MLYITGSFRTKFIMRLLYTCNEHSLCRVPSKFPNEIENFVSEKESSEIINAIHVKIRIFPKSFDNLLAILIDGTYSFNELTVSVV